MAAYCRACGAALAEGANFCPACGTSVINTGYDSTYYDGTTTADGTAANTENGGSDMLKTAAVAGGVALGVSALSGIARRMTHRRRPPYMGPMGGMGMGGPGPGGPGGPRGRM